MQRAKLKEEDPEVAIGPKTDPAAESSPKNGNREQDSPRMGIKEEAAGESMKARTGPKKKRRRLPPVAKGTWRPLLGPERILPSPPDKTQLEQYMNESLQQWFRLEFLMDYDYQGNQLHCMMCTTALPSLSLTDIKHHILDNHPTSLQFSPTQKSVILDAWINRKETLEAGEDMTPEFEVGEDMTPELEAGEDMTPELEAGEDMTPELEAGEDMTPEAGEDMTPEAGEDMTPEAGEDMTPEAGEDMTPEAGEDMDDDEADEKLSNIDVKDDQVAQTTTDSRSKNRMLKAKCFSDLIEKESVHYLGEENIDICSPQLMEKEKLKPTDIELLEEEEPITGDVQLLDKEEWNTKEVQLLADEKWKARKKPLLESEWKARALLILEENQKAREASVLEEEKPKAKEGQVMGEEKSKSRERQLLEEEQKTREKQLLEEQEKIREAALLEEEQQKARETQLLEEEKKAKDAQILEEEKKAKEAQLFEEEKKAREVQMLEDERKAREVQLLEDKKKARDVQLLEEEKKARDFQLLEKEKKKAREAQLLEEDKTKTREAQLLDEDRVKETKALEPKVQEKLKEVQGLSREAQNVKQEIIVKIEDHHNVELAGNDKEETQSANNVQTEKQHIIKKIVIGGKTLSSEPLKHIIKVQPMPKAPAVLGIGLPLLKMETPTPIIITRVSVLPEHTILQPSKPKPSTSASDISKTWRVIAPKISQVDNQNPRLASASTDTPQSPAGVDPTVWEVSVWRGNNGNLVQCNTYQMRWRSDYLMDFNGVRGSVVCMYCSSTLTVLKESSIKRHIVQKHPHTANFTAEEKATVMRDWENKLSEIKKMALKPIKEGVAIGDQDRNIVKAPDCDPVEPEEEESSWAGVLPEGKGASWEFAFGRLQGAKDPRKYQHDRWKLEFLMDYTPAKDGLICMVCGATLMNPKISTVKMHIQQKHPDTTYLSDQEKAVVMEEWEQKLSVGKKTTGPHHGEDEICIEINEDSTTSETNGSSAATSSPRPEITLPTKSAKSTPSLPPPCNSAKRNYQVRWRTEFMMDYDCRRQGLICMVCGGTLATLKVSTIKRHIVQVHPYSVDFTAEERQRILEAYSEMALHYIHSEECFKTQPQEEVKGRKRKSLAMEES
ncbi:zinc finger translocation-associated protein isoform X2 [Rhinoderma darwinii]|uniref:zinc finger translocation-associated protein isoform X2 n=1 Tax=Rhinoderma darwinii TaxID=43563 RepID=UPI003F6655F3